MTEGEETTVDDPTKGFMESAPQPIETDYELGQDNVSPFGLEIHNPVFPISALAIARFVLITLMWTFMIFHLTVSALMLPLQISERFRWALWSDSSVHGCRKYSIKASM